MIQIQIFVLKLLTKLLKLLGAGSGTALPGLIAEKYFSNVFEHLTSELNKVVIITGTNGKTTTRFILEEILKTSYTGYISNRAGSNMKRGLISALIFHSNIFGRLKTDFAVFEVEEATLPRIIKYLKPDILIVTNLFRDQLDAYGEINKTRDYIKEAIDLSPKTQLVLNADDPLVASLQKNPEKTYFFSIEQEYRKEIEFESSEIREVDEIHKIVASEIKVYEDLTSSFVAEKETFYIKTPGIFHIYNAIAAILTAQLLEISLDAIGKAIRNFQPAFGRGEEVEYKDRIFQLLLIKNPIGFSLTLDLLTNISSPNLLIIINDRIADGRDVSWLWDSKVELINKINPKRIFVSGTRAEDMALRLKYAGIDISKITYNPNQSQIFKTIIKETESNERIYVLPTYTAMNEFRKLLGKKLDN